MHSAVLGIPQSIPSRLMLQSIHAENYAKISRNKDARATVGEGGASSNGDKF